MNYFGFYKVTPISNTGNVIVTDNNALRGVDHNNNALTNFVQTRNTYSTRGRSCSTYYKSQYGLMYHNNKVYFLGSFRPNETGLYHLNTSTGRCDRIKDYGRKSVLGKLLVSNNILVFPNNQNKILLRDTNSGVLAECSTSGDLLKSLQKSFRNNRMGATIDSSGKLVFKSYELQSGKWKIIFRKFTK